MAMERTSDGRPLCILAVIVEYGWEWPSLYGARRIRSGDVSDGPSVQFLMRGLPEHILSDNRPEFAARAVRKCLNQLDVTRLFIEPRSPWEFGYVESFIGKLRDELLTGEGLDTPDEAKVLAKAMRTAYNRLRLHSSRGYAPPAPDAYVVGNVALGPVKCNETGQNNRPMSI